MIRAEENPFPGLRPFDSRDANRFYGRTRQIDELRTRLDDSRFLAVVGSSGVGKSSLVYAGLIPRLREEGSWRIMTMMPRGKPVAALAAAFLGMLAREELADAPLEENSALADHIRTTLNRSRMGLVELCDQWLPKDGKRLCIIVDQFEEIFRFRQIVRPDGNYLATQDEVERFVSLLLNTAESHSLANVILTMRADYLGDCIAFDRLPEFISHGQYLVPRLNRDELREVIEGPLRLTDATIDHDLVEQVLNDCTHETDSLPVLQHVLRCLFQDASVNRGENAPPRPLELTLDSYNELGGMRNAISVHANRVIEELAQTSGEPVVTVIEGIMRTITQFDHEGRAIRRPVTFARLVSETGFDSAELLSSLDEMRADTRAFLRPGPNVRIDDDTVIDVGHEALFRRWNRMQDLDKIDSRGRASGWLLDEVRDGEAYRTLLELAEERDGETPLPLPTEQARARLRWWYRRPRTEDWTRRYGGGRDKVVDLLSVSEKALQTDVTLKTLSLTGLIGIVVVLALTSWAILKPLGVGF